MQLVAMDGMPIISRRDASEAPLHLAEGPHAGSLRLASTAIAHGEAVLRDAAKHAMPRARRQALLVAKRLFDIAGASLLLLVAAPFMLLVGLTIRLTDRGPALFGHQRVGRNGVPFRCLKFRSMAVNAEAALAQLLASDPEARAEWAATRKLRRDPRITPIGRFLRASSLDELPQLLNVLRGEMSLVGPRPVVSAELDEHYGPDARPYYLSVRPGMTGLWQISGRNDASYRERVALDIDYVRRLSLWGDVSILLRTLAVVVSRRGAY